MDKVEMLKRRLKESKVISKDVLKMFQLSDYRVTTVVPLEKNPKMKIYIFNQKEFNDFLEGYGEYAEFIVSVDRVLAKA